MLLEPERNNTANSANNQPVIRRLQVSDEDRRRIVEKRLDGIRTGYPQDAQTQISDGKHYHQKV